MRLLKLSSSSGVLYEKNMTVKNFKDEKCAPISCTYILAVTPLKTKMLLRYHCGYYGKLAIIATWYVANEALYQIRS